jgi:SH3-like domain-containing protein
MSIFRRIAACTKVLLTAVILLTAAGGACAMDFVSVVDPSAILYDAPSLKAKKLYVVSRFTPLEQVVALDAWVKVRDRSGAMAWIEKRTTSNNRYVTVIVEQTTMRQAPGDNAAVIAQVMRDVALELLGPTGDGWIKVRHMNGATGYVKVGDVWGN